MARLEGLTPNELVARIIRDTIQEHRDSGKPVRPLGGGVTPRQREIAILTGQN